MKKSNLSLLTLLFVLGHSILGSAADQPPATTPITNSDIYCQHLQEMQARALREKKEPGPLESIFNFVNALTKKVSLEDIEKQALEKKMTFEEFQKWAQETHSLPVKDHFKAQYLADYIKHVCGEITFSATFSDKPDPEVSATADKKFDPTGHPYADELLKDKK